MPILSVRRMIRYSHIPGYSLPSPLITSARRSFEVFVFILNTKLFLLIIQQYLFVNILDFLIKVKGMLYSKCERHEVSKCLYYSRLERFSA